ncbi:MULTISPECIES: hypothetical protein [unclassified Virgibacillus]|uniref:ATP-grasp domain-containing protein n=1 Tax=unclassified Virgibacillus TaxID=2620237 RepID=UPI0024DE6434|nr:hypothetical protein [Virgibacillus sp. LDC-1]
MYTAWLIYKKMDAADNHAYIEWFKEEAKKQDIQLTLVLRETMQIGVVENERALFIDSTRVELPDIAIVRTVEPLLNEFLESLGVTVFNSAKVAKIANHKGLTHFEISKLGIPMVDTFFVSKEMLQKEKPPMPFPFVIKEVAGRGGRHVYLIKNIAEWDQQLKTLVGKEWIIQQTNVQKGKDLRVFIVGKDIIGAVLRESSLDFRANYKLGGTASLYTLSREEIAMINPIISHFDFGMVGIDFLIGKNDELLFNEIEDVVGSRTLSAVSDVNILRTYLSFIKRTMDKQI